VSDWREQYGRILRLRYQWGTRTCWPEEGVFDHFYAFAKACYHLVDWLENDKSQPIRRAQANRHVATSPALTLCRDICNGTKHGVLETKDVQTERRTRVIGGYTELDANREVIRERLVHEQRLFVHFDGDSIPAATFAIRCIEEWNRLLAAEGLDTRTEALRFSLPGDLPESGSHLEDSGDPAGRRPE
jgi:hypothetical protein